MKFTTAAMILASLVSPTSAFRIANLGSTTARSAATAAYRRRAASTFLPNSSAAIAASSSSLQSTYAHPRRQLTMAPLTLRGGCSALFSSTTTAEESTTETTSSSGPKEIFRSDYTALPFKVSNVSMNFDIRDGETFIESELTIVQNTGEGDLVLDGEADALTLLSISLDGKDLVEGVDYSIDGDTLTIVSSLLPTTADGTSVLKTKVKVHPEKNTQLSGLYKSGSMYCTQCEAMGFRRITYYPDRPDNMAIFDSVRIEADKEAYPVLLGNGNKLEGGDVEGDRHYAVWEDPYPKPSYLFCIVAGKLGSVSSSYTTVPSGRKVHLEVYSEPENVSKLGHALESLKKSMKWDEDTFGLEYDLDVYNVVAVNDFNMGAMENKGLNVFNTAYCLADPKSATDLDYERIESVIGHEYFHNWTGNRVTCRDWFQLTLKEGLTVYRDQEFSGDMMQSHAVKRIEDVSSLRGRQFAEDAGPMSHPVRPDSYISMDNFYTATVYSKGAEVVRMYRTLLGKDGFRKGMDLYFERHDGNAVTCDDFLSAMGDANGVDISQFSRWYQTNGTPTVKYSSKYDEESKTYYLTLTQESNSDEPLLIPISVGLLDKASGEEVVATKVLELKEKEQTFEFDGLNGDVLPSMLRGFSAPVKLVQAEADASEEEDLAFLAARDTDGFNRWEAGQKLYTSLIFQTLEGNQDESKTLDYVEEAFGRALNMDGNDYSIQAYALTLPSESTLAEEMTVVDPVALHKARGDVRESLAQKYLSEIRAKYDELTETMESSGSGEDIKLDATSIGQRRLRNVLLGYLCCIKDTAEERDAASELAMKQFESSYGMTDRYSALNCLASMDGEESVVARRDAALQKFYDDANGDALVLNKWFMCQAVADLPDVLDRVKALVKHPDFTLTNPNRCSSLISAFTMNAAHFHAEDGEGYNFLGDMTAQVDKLNPQLSSRMGRGLIQWRKYSEERGALMKEALQELADMKPISSDLFEVVSSSLKE
ncbi:aminopeptidase N [Skeletonema marinoi]|uniref:Aminopeptidase N n=1 Tax=Skeletonema marinoi TaxID=267567 RepID=A0AAD8Y6X8_9STRA|nr:aminopeptidase N [Skeletonema marinoi]